MDKDFMNALEELERTKNIKKDVMLEALETALITACKKNYSDNLYFRVSIDPENGKIEAYTQKKVVEEVLDAANEISQEDAKAISAKYEIDDFVDFQVEPKRFGRIAAQTAKQMVVQKIREAERGHVAAEYMGKENKLVTGVIQKEERQGLMVKLEDGVDAVLPAKEQLAGEAYSFGTKMKFYVLEIRNAYKGPQIILSRTHPGLIRRLFEQEIPEIADGTVEIKSISREAGSRTKIAVYSENENVDPIGACVGQRGMRVEQVLSELGQDEKIDIIKYSEDVSEYICAALSPAKVVSVEVEEEGKSAKVIVPDFQLSLAIGKEGQNVRLAARLTGWKIDIKSDSAAEDSGEEA